MEAAEKRSTCFIFLVDRIQQRVLYWAKQQFREVAALGFRYGQKHEVELQQAKIIAEKAGVPFRVIDITGMLQGSALTEHDKDVAAPHELNAQLPALLCLVGMRFSFHRH
jgi:7-cyano-7-deazaguanine synthase in queuosine biosynthesis